MPRQHLIAKTNQHKMSGNIVQPLTLLVVSNNSLSNCLTDGVDLSGSSTTLGSNTDVNLWQKLIQITLDITNLQMVQVINIKYLGESLLAEKENWLKGLQSEDFRLNQREGSAVHFDQTIALLHESNSSSGFLLNTIAVRTSINWIPQCLSNLAAKCLDTVNLCTHSIFCLFDLSLATQKYNAYNNKYAKTNDKC